MAIGLLALLDDIATLLDDVALLSKVAAKKTAGVLGDDLALNAEQVSGVRAERELPVVWAVFKGSTVNKLILVPVALLLSVFLPQVITPLLMLGGAYLCFEGSEKLLHAIARRRQGEHSTPANLKSSLRAPNIDLVAIEKSKIKGAIRTDFILSAEIVVIVLGTVQEASLSVQAVTLAIVALLITVAVYGTVAAIVKLDDLGLYLTKIPPEKPLANFQNNLGRVLLHACPYLMKGLSVLGTVAMFLVGGGILLHALPSVHHYLEGIWEGVSVLHALTWLQTPLLNGLIGLLLGFVLVGLWDLFSQLIKK